MWDLATDNVSHQLINEFFEADKIISSVCHGPAALAKVKITSTGKYFLDGEAVTGYSNVEEEMAGVRDIMPYASFLALLILLSLDGLKNVLMR